MTGISNDSQVAEDRVVKLIREALHDYDNLMGYTPKQVVDRARNYIKEFDND